jgi:hypothetical protein
LITLLFPLISFLGYNTALTLNLYEHSVAKLKPAIVIVGLSLANEGMDDVSFMKNMSRLVEWIKGNGAICIVAGVYPNNLYSDGMWKIAGGQV